MRKFSYLKFGFVCFQLLERLAVNDCFVCFCVRPFLCLSGSQHVISMLQSLYRLITVVEFSFRMDK